MLEPEGEDSVWCGSCTSKGKGGNFLFGKGDWGAWKAGAGFLEGRAGPCCFGASTRV